MAQEIVGTAVVLEKSLQVLMEQNLDTLLGVSFLASEYTTGPKHGGRIDTLGMDENGCPVIIEYKRATNENVINQGLFYLDWLMDHRAEFQLSRSNSGRTRRKRSTGRHPGCCASPGVSASTTNTPCNR